MIEENPPSRAHPAPPTKQQTTFHSKLGEICFFVTAEVPTGTSYIALCKTNFLFLVDAQEKT